MFKRSIIALFILLFAASFIFAQSKQSAGGEYEKHLEYMRKEVQKREVWFMIRTPKREGRDAISYSSGFAISEIDHEIKYANGNSVKYTKYLVLSNPHIVSDEEWDLAEYEKHNVRIYVLGRKSQALAQIIAWDWTEGVILFEVNIPKDQLDNFKIQVVEFSNELPVSLDDSKYLDKDASTIWLGGYPTRRPVAYPSYVISYFYNYEPNYYTYFTKVAEVDPGSLYGSGQSGAAVFNKDLQVVGIVWGIIYPYGTSDSVGIIIPIDVVVERFLKNLSELKDVKLPDFNLEDWIKRKPVFISRPIN